MELLGPFINSEIRRRREMRLARAAYRRQCRLRKKDRDQRAAEKIRKEAEFRANLKKAIDQLELDYAQNVLRGFPHCDDVMVEAVSREWLRGGAEDANHRGMFPEDWLWRRSMRCWKEIHRVSP